MIDSNGYAELLARRPFLFHRVWGADDARLGSVLDNGLERVSSQYVGFFESRPGHVYMGDRASVLEIEPECDPDTTPWALLRIDVAHLEPCRFSADEDHFMVHSFCDHESARRGEQICRQFHIEFPPSKWVWEWAEYLRLKIPSLGQWADAVGLGADPAEVRYSLSRGTVAYRGVVPPAALRVVERHACA